MLVVSPEDGHLHDPGRRPVRESCISASVATGPGRAPAGFVRLRPHLREGSKYKHHMDSVCIHINICINIYTCGTPPKDLPNSMLLETLLATFASKIVQRSVGRILDPD